MTKKGKLAAKTAVLKRCTFTREFKLQVIREIEAGKTQAQAAREYQISDSTDFLCHFRGSLTMGCKSVGYCQVNKRWCKTTVAASFLATDPQFARAFLAYRTFLGRWNNIQLLQPKIKRLRWF